MLQETEDPERDRYRKAKKDWDDKYRFFSRPFNLSSDQGCGSFDSIRMKGYFDHIFSGDPPIEDTPPVSEPVNARDLSSRLESCSRLVELSRLRSKEMGNCHSHAGYNWPQYKYFSSGLQCPSSGIVDKYLITDDRFKIPV